jgi:hypothetical protein
MQKKIEPPVEKSTPLDVDSFTYALTRYSLTRVYFVNVAMHNL